jgi:hypothetical protein
MKLGKTSQLNKKEREKNELFGLIRQTRDPDHEIGTTQ